MRWFPNLANEAFCATIELRSKIAERQSMINSRLRQALEPSSAEFIAALAAGINSRVILQVGCGMSTIALAAAAQVTGGLLVSIHIDEGKQDIVRHHMKYLGLLTFVEFIVSEPLDVLLTRKNINYAHFTGDPKDYVELFDLLDLTHGAIVTADNAFSEASSEYVKHVRRQPGVDSSTLPLGGGMEVTKVLSWEMFKSGRIVYSDLDNGVVESIPNEVRLMSCAHEETTLLYSDMAEESSSGVEGSQGANGECSSEEIHVSKKVVNMNMEPKGSRVNELPCTSSRRVYGGSSQNGADASEGPSIEKDTKDHYFSTKEITYDGASTSSYNKFDVSSVFGVYFHNHRTETEVLITGVNQDMLLSDITTVFSDMGISVKTANISTQGNLIEDIFFVNDAKSGGPLHPSLWNPVRDRILLRIGERWGQIWNADASHGPMEVVT